MAGVKVSTFLGRDVFFDAANKGQFYANANAGGGYDTVYGKTLDEVEKQLADKFVAKGVVKVMVKPWVEYGPKAIEVKEVSGFKIDRGRGRGAVKTLEYTLSGGGTSNVRTSYCEYDESVVEEMKKLLEEEAAAKIEFRRRASEIVGKMKPISGEEIFDRLQKGNGEKPTRLKVVS